MEIPGTPRVQMLLEKIQGLNRELTVHMSTLVSRLTHMDQEPIVLKAALYNIVDRKADKKRHQESTDVTLKEVVDSPVEYDEQLR
jgi:hypothetical protein